MDDSRLPSSLDHRRVLDLLGSLNELAAAGHVGEARRFLLTRAQQLLGAAAIFWTVLEPDLRASSAPDPTGAVRTDIHGLDDQQRALWEKPFFDGGQFVENPLWQPLRADVGPVRARLRASVVTPAEWSAHPQNEFGRALGFDDDVAALAPIGGGREVLIVASTALHDPRFAERERTLLELLASTTRWFFQRLIEPLRDDDGRLRLAGLRSQLAPRLRPVLDQLLSPRSEKEIAAHLGLSPRTVHKYAEHLFRATGVSSRIELMAQLTPAPRRES